jgi:uncharacterized protein
VDQSTRQIFVIHELNERIAVVRMEPRDEVPEWAWTGSLAAVVRTVDELTIVCDQKVVPGHLRCECDWTALKLEGPMALSLTGVLASLLGPLSFASIPVFVVSTFDTDYILVKADNVQRARDIFKAQGHDVH